MRFAIRDDDTNYFTEPEELVRIYGNIWDKCPISLSVVPFHTGAKTGAIPEKYWGSDKIFPIGENKKLVEFLREKIKEGKICIMLHGYSHKDYQNGYEFEVGDNLYSKVKEGKKYLEEIFGIEIKTFVPPHNSLSKEGFKAVIRNNLNIANVHSFRLSKRPFSLNNVIPFLKQKYYIWRYKNSYPYVFHFRDHSELRCYGLVPETTLESLINDFNFCYRHNGDFCLATHYWEFLRSEKMRRTFEEFWEYVNEKDKIKFCSVDELMERTT